MGKRMVPQTSKDALASLKAEEIREMYRRILEALRLIKEGSRDEIAVVCKVKPEKVWKRFSELQRMNLIYRPGNKKPLESGRLGYTWRLVGDEPTAPVTEKALPGKSVGQYAKSILQQQLF